jgi:hypothetical protein
MIRSSVQKDKKRNHYDKANFIDYNHILNLIKQADDRCYYCSCKLQYINHSNNLGTIERLDNTIGHVKGNCAIACLRCNVKKVGDKRKRDE